MFACEVEKDHGHRFFGVVLVAAIVVFGKNVSMLLMSQS